MKDRGRLTCLNSLVRGWHGTSEALGEGWKTETIGSSGMSDGDQVAWPRRKKTCHYRWLGSSQGTFMFSGEHTKARRDDGSAWQERSADLPSFRRFDNCCF